MIRGFRLGFFQKLLVFLILFASACKKNTSPPIQAPTNCGITVTPSEGYVQQPFSFAGCSEGANGYLWYFGDGDTSQRPNPTHSYDYPGTYNVSFAPNNSGIAASAKTYSLSVRYPSWTFKSYKHSNPDISRGTFRLEYFHVTHDTTYALEFEFYNTLPTTPGTFTVISGPRTAANQVSVEVYNTITSTNTTDIYNPCTTCAQTINVSTSSNGTLIITSPGIELYNENNPSDSSLLILDLLNPK